MRKSLVISLCAIYLVGCGSENKIQTAVTQLVLPYVFNMTKLNETKIINNSSDRPRTIIEEIEDLWKAWANSLGRVDISNQLEQLEDLGLEILSGFNEREKSTVYFYLFNRNNDGSHLIKFGSVKNLRQSTFVPHVPVKFLIHGFKMNGFSHFSYLLKEAYLKYGENVNIISVDWRRLAGDPIYFNAAFNTRIVGERVGEFLIFLKNKKFIRSFEDIHLIGFSLGAHVAGYAGKYVIKTARMKIGRITGLDPAGPSFSGTDALIDLIMIFDQITFTGYHRDTRSLFHNPLSGPNPNNRLDADDAGFVDVIHTCMGKSGIVQSLGHIDFFPNGGSDQPGCDWEKISDFFLRNCSHERAFYLYLETIRGMKYIGCPCKSWEDFLASNCNCTSSSTDAALMGEYCNYTSRGDKYLVTGDQFPSTALKHWS